MDENTNNTEIEENYEEEEGEMSNDDLKKLTVAVLKNIAEKKGLSGYKSLKKQNLINLILDNK